MAKNLVIVESPAKAATIEKYLGADFKVLASVGHIRKDTKVDKNTFDVTYEIDPEHKKIISELQKAAREADKIWLATDEDREGEAISWHLCQVLHLPDDTSRITFHEITKSALENAIASPRTVDMNMVSSQQARQTLDMLVGFDLSGVVRKKVPGAISAGRVQSPALRLIVEREHAIEKHASKSVYKVSADFGFAANLDHDFETEEEAYKFLASLINFDFTVASVKTADGVKKPLPPFTTATMQIEANSRLGFSTRTTMNAAQSLYQAGLITYHRTDSLNLSKQALASMASFVENTYGKNYVKVRNYHTKSAGAQEAHEAIRPTDITRETAGKSDYERRLYALIRGRALASQMADAKVAKTTITINTPAEYIFKGEGEVITFDGFLKVYGRLKENELPTYKEGDKIAVLTDILGDEDHLGDMDFKVCGTEDKITAIQMDIKITGISREIMAQALKQAHDGRRHILGCMLSAIAETRGNKSKYAPQIKTLKVKPEKIRDIIGSGGKTIRNICAVSGAQVNVEDDGTVTVSSGDGISLQKAIDMINGLTREAKIGNVYMGTVKKIMDFGAFVEIFPGTDGMVHISELTEGHVDNVTDVLKEGEQVLVKVLAIDPRGKIKLSRRAAIGEQPTEE